MHFLRLAHSLLSVKPVQFLQRYYFLFCGHFIAIVSISDFIASNSWKESGTKLSWINPDIIPEFA
jgi:hypothetical protein